MPGNVMLAMFSFFNYMCELLLAHVGTNMDVQTCHYGFTRIGSKWFGIISTISLGN